MQNHFIFLIENVVINVFGSGPAIMDFKVEEPWNNEKYCRPPWLAERKNFWILDALEWPKQKHFDPNKNPLIVSALKLFPLLPFYIFATQKSEEEGTCMLLTLWMQIKDTWPNDVILKYSNS